MIYIYKMINFCYDRMKTERNRQNVAGEGLEIIGSNEEEPGRCRIFGWRHF